MPASTMSISHAQLMVLKKTRLRLSLGMTLLTLGVYFAFILSIAFSPHWLTLPLFASSPLTTGLVAGVGLYWFCVAITGFYTWRANRSIDPLLLDLQRSGQR
ncbi:DUF485 domain-containing protein [Chromobacterium haemolyticum]|uniref:DUF485 domain-containing protein n=1 Tax=Chromobacterium fluminis TaxID=3044269 RepID=A0ABX0L7R5_9NEIS|nr:DUF485 domain-containing protein [Chromobacterium haemolyticum]NHR05411.1 DUF485 domain-containing protein [Chromobacterium haemolyticum]